MGMHIIVTGNPVDGFQFFGPFSTKDDAILFADYNPPESDWWVAPLESQSELPNASE